jgi:diguanylate cyclase (GGDEF)-like protein
MVGKNIARLFPADVVGLLQDHMGKVFQEGNSQVFRFTLRQGERVSYQEARLVPAGGEQVLAIIRDVTEETKLEQQLRYLVSHDSLTGLYNRAYFAAEMQCLASGSHPVGIVVCDVNGLKTVNDTLGHSWGDKLLKTAADLIGQAFGDSGAIARIGGDEFAVILPGVTAAALRDACERLRKSIARHNRAKPDLYVSISCGAALSSGEMSEPGEIFKAADAAMYADKSRHSRGGRDGRGQKIAGIPLSPVVS